LIISDLFDKAHGLIDRLELVVARIAIWILKDNHVLRHEPLLLIGMRLTV
jgi:hypothetical protein